MVNLRYILYVLLLGFSLSAQAKTWPIQPEEVLINELKRVQDTAKINTLNALSAHYLDFYLDSKQALIYSQQALQLSKKLAYQKGEIESLLRIGLAYSLNQDYNRTKQYLEQALQLSKRIHFKEGMVWSLNGLVSMYRSQSLYKEAFENARQALAISNKNRNKTLRFSVIFEMGRIFLQQADHLKGVECFLQVAKGAEGGKDYAMQMLSFTNLGIIHENLKEYDKAIFYHLEALKIHGKFAKRGSVMSLVNLGLTYYLKKDYQKALFYTQSAYKEAQKGRNKLVISTCLTNLGHIYLRLNVYQEALTHFTKAMAIHQAINYEEGIIDVFNGLSELYLALGQYPKAINRAIQALQLIKKTEIKHKSLESYNNLSKAYAHTGNYAKAYFYQSRLKALQDTLFNEESTSKIALLQNRHELERKQNQINLLAKEKQLQHAEISKQNLIRYVLLIGLIVVLFFSLLLLIAYRGKHLTNLTLKRRNKEISEISEKLKLTQQKLSSALSLGLVGTWILDKKQDLILIDENVARMFGLAANTDRIPLKDLLDLVHPEDKKAVEGQIESALKQQPEYEAEYRVIHPSNGRTIWILSKGATELDEQGNVKSYSGVSIDITDRKDADRHKNEFLSIASHELRTPLASVKGYLQLLERTLDSKNGSYSFVTKASTQLKRLERLTSDLMDVSKISAGKLQYEYSEFNFSQTLKDLVESMQYTVTSHQIILEDTVDINFYGDRYRIEQVINNLLSNAIKYSPNADKVIVRAEKAANSIMVSIQDFGIGIEQKHLDRLYERFYRVKSDSEKYDGLGLGLFIASEILIHHNGYFGVESERGHGSKFYFQLPIRSKKAISTLEIAERTISVS